MEYDFPPKDCHNVKISYREMRRKQLFKAVCRRNHKYHPGGTKQAYDFNMNLSRYLK